MKISLLILLPCLFYPFSYSISPDQINSSQKDAFQTQQQVKKLKDDLYALEGSIFYKKHLSPMNTMREKTAFVIALAGICASCITPFKLIPSDPKHRMKSYLHRGGIAAITFSGCMLSAYAVSFFRPILWYQEHKRDSLKKKIFELQNSR